MEEISREHIKPKETIKATRIELSSVDMSIPKCYSSMAWIFKTPFPEAFQLGETLSQLVSSEGFAPLSGCMQPGDEAGRDYIEFGTGTRSPGVLFVVSRFESLQVDDFQCGNPLCPALGHPIFETLDADYDKPTSQPCHVLAVKVIHISNGSAVVLAISLHHRVGDGSALSLFVSAWARYFSRSTRGTVIQPPEFSRSFIDSVEQQQQQQQQQLEPPAAAATAAATTGPIEAPDMSLFIGARPMFEKFTIAELEKLKAKATAKAGEEEGGGGQKWISTKDALLAHVWRCFIETSPVAKPNTNLRASLAVDVRKRIEGFPERYFGNAALVVPVVSATEAPLTKEEITREPLRKTALRIREAIESAKGDRAKQMISTIGMKMKAKAKAMGGQQQGNVLGGFRVGIDLTSSDWSAISFTKADFGDHNPILVVPAKSISLPGLVVFMEPSPAHPDFKSIGLVMFLHVTAVQAEILTKSNALHNF